MTTSAIRFGLVIAFAGLGLAAPVRAADVAKIAEECANCHGKDGVSTESDVPIIAGVSAAYLETSLNGYAKKEWACVDTKFKSGPKKGNSTNMCEVAKGLGGDTAQVAKYFASKKFVRATQTFDAELAKKGKAIHDQGCEKCHSSGGSDPKDDAGVLAGQWMPYLKATLEDYMAGKRPMDKKMKPRIEKLDKAGVEALVNYYASVK
jgi:sulfide dehydrogenase cytochrome subunit